MNGAPGVVTAFVDQVARDQARQATDDLAGHEDLCAERYKNINDTLKTIKSILAWAGTTIFGLLTLTLGWLIVQQFNRNNDDKTLLRAQVELLQQQMRPSQESTAH